jgi:hypothetical protein
MRVLLSLIFALASTNVALAVGGRLVPVTDNKFHEKIVNVYVPEGYKLDRCTIDWQDINPATAVAVGFQLSSPTSRIVEVPIRYGCHLNVAMPAFEPTYFGIPWSRRVPTFESVVERVRRSDAPVTITKVESTGVQRLSDGSLADIGCIYYTDGKVDAAILVRCQYVVSEGTTIWAVNEYELVCPHGSQSQEWPNFLATVWNSRLTPRAAQGCEMIQKAAVQIALNEVEQDRIRSGIIARLGNETSEIIMDTWRHYNEVTDAALSRWSDAFRGVQEYPLGDGLSVKLPIGPDRWWAGSDRSFVGCPAGVNPNSNQEPGVTYTPLEAAR